MADFLIAYGLTIKNEGGYTCDPDDSGNWTGGVKGRGALIGTNLGISAPVLMEYLGRVPTAKEMQNLQPLTAQAIYKDQYWKPLRGDEIVSQAIANSTFDMAVNAGVGRSIKLLQIALDMAQTGKMDDITLNKVNNK